MDRFQIFLLVAPALLFSMVAHEYAHGYAALKQGDPTAQQLGRLTWNPLKHIDPFMTVILPVLLMIAGAPPFGGAKPVPVDARNYRHYKRGDIIVSLAGIVVNLCLAVICTGLIIVLGWVGRAAEGAVGTVAVLQAMAYIGVFFNLILAFFNLLPIPPLDGSHVFKYLLPPSWAVYYQRIGFLGIFLLMFLIYQGWLTRFYAGPVLYFLNHSIDVAGSAFLPEAEAILLKTPFFVRR